MKILLLGHTGKMGRALMEVLGHHDVTGTNSKDFNAARLITGDFRFKTTFDIIINCVAFMSIDRCEVLQNKALKINSLFPCLAAKSCEHDQVFIHFSSDAVFPDGGPWSEDDMMHPSNWYGRTKAFADNAIPLINPKYYICRLPVLFGESNSNQFVEKMLAHNGNLRIADDIITTPTYSLDVARAVKDLIESEAEFGTYHITNGGQASLYDLMKEIVNKLDLEKSVRRASYKDFPYIGKKNTHTPLISKKLKLRHWREAVGEYCTRLGGGQQWGKIRLP